MYDDREEPNPICNFLPELLSVFDVYNGEDGNPIRCVNLKLGFDNDEYSNEFTEILSTLESVKWVNKDNRCMICPDCSPAKAQRYLANSIREKLTNIKVEKVYSVGRLGTHIIEDIPFFCTGGEVIFPVGAEDKLKIDLKPIPYNLDIDPNLTEKEAIVGMLELMSLSPDAFRVVVSHILLYIMRLAYKSAWKAPCCIVFLWGKTGTFKTSTSALLTQIYNFNDGIEPLQRLNASIPKAEELLYEKSDVVVCLDDLFPTVFKANRQKQEATLDEITRIIGDGISRGRKGDKNSGKSPTSGVMFIGEYVADTTGSSAARLLPVELSPPPDGEKLKQFQDSPLFISTFYNGFIKFFILNYYEIVDYLKEWWTAYEGVDLAVHDRLNEAHFFLSTAYAILLQYCFEKEVISEQDAQELYCSFWELLTTLVKEQQARVNAGTATEHSTANDVIKMNYLTEIKKLYKTNNFVLAESAEQFSDDVHDGVRHNGHLCLRGNRLIEKLRPIASTVSISDVIRDLKSQGALVVGNDNKPTKQIYAAGKKRFYFIPLDLLN